MADKFGEIMSRMHALRASEGGGNDTGAGQPEPASEAAETLDRSSEPVHYDDEPGQDQTETSDEPIELVPDQPDPEPLKVSSLEDVAKALDVPVGDLYKISVPMSLDGRRVDVPLGEWKDNYQSSDKLESRERFLTQKQQEVESRAAQWADRLSKAEESAKVWGDMLNAEEQSVDWKSLREDDPTEYVAKKQEFQDRKARLDQHFQALHQQRTEAVSEHEQRAQQQYQQALAEERERLLSALPAWRDEKVASSERTKVSAYLKNRGFSDQEIMGVADHRAILIARDAMLYRDAVNKAKAGKKDAKSASPTIKPSGRAERKTVQQEKVDQARQRLRKTGKMRDATALYRATRSKGSK